MSGFVFILPHHLIYLMKKLLLIILAIGCFTARAQFRDVERFDDGVALSVTTHYDLPVGNLGYTFKPAMAYGFNVIAFSDGWTGNCSIGYEVFKPKLNTFYYKADDTNIGKISYQDYSALSLYLGLAYNFHVTEKFWIFTGLNLGVYYTHYAYNLSDIYGEDFNDFHEKNLYGAPKAGVTFVLSNNILVSLESKYNFFSPLGKKPDNDRLVILYNSWANGVALTYKF